MSSKRCFWMLKHNIKKHNYQRDVFYGCFEDVFSYLCNRCVVIVSGFFEWNQDKKPYAFKHVQILEEVAEDKPVHFYVAALYGSDETVILLTREANDEISAVHHRMPVLLDESEIDLWLNVDKYKFEKIFEKEIMDEKNGEMEENTVLSDWSIRE